jgi:hypothetical protein
MPDGFISPHGLEVITGDPKGTLAAYRHASMRQYGPRFHVIDGKRIGYAIADVKTWLHRRADQLEVKAAHLREIAEDQQRIERAIAVSNGRAAP